MYYFCYVSEAKVEQILSQSSLGVADRVTELAERFRGGKGQLSAKFLALFGAGAEYGRQSTLRFSRERRETAVAKLLAALGVLEQQMVVIPDLEEGLLTCESISPGAYTYAGDFRVLRYDSEFAYLESPLACGKRLLLTCSLRYFSDVLNHEGKFVPHSGNAFFFSGEIAPHLHALLYVLDSRTDAILGTPVYLGLPLDSPLQL